MRHRVITHFFLGPNMQGSTAATQRTAVAVPFVGLTYVVLLLLYEVLLALSGAEGLTFRIVFFVPFILIFAASAIGVWRRARWGFVLGAVSSAFFVLFGLPYNIPIFVDPTNTLFLAVWTGNLALIIVVAGLVASYFSRRRLVRSPKGEVG